MAWKKVEVNKVATPLLWLVWKDRIGEEIEGYFLGLFKHSEEEFEEVVEVKRGPKVETIKEKKTRIIPVVLIYDDVEVCIWRAFIAGSLKRVFWDEIPRGCRVKFIIKERSGRPLIEMLYDPEDALTANEVVGLIPREYLHKEVEWEEVDFPF